MRKSLAGMSLTALRKYAREDLGLTGLSKAPRDVVLAAINGASQPKAMDRHKRVESYLAQTGRSGVTPAQARRIRKHENRAKGRA